MSVHLNTPRLSEGCAATALGVSPTRQGELISQDSMLNPP